MDCADKMILLIRLLQDQRGQQHKRIALFAQPSVNTQHIIITQNILIMKKSIKKLSLNKKAVSSLSSEITGGLRRAGNTGGPLTCTDPTLLTHCYHCPPQEQR